MKSYVSFIATGDINLPWRHCCTTLDILHIWHWQAAIRHTHNAV